MDPKRKIQLIAQTNEACTNMIVNVRLLRLSVLDLFTTLADNGPSPIRSQQTYQDKLYHQQTLASLATAHSLCSSTPPLGLQKQQEQQQQVDLLQYVNQMISSIAATVRSLDQDIAILQQNKSFTNAGESVHSGLDSSLDKHNLYRDLCKSFKTYAKLQDYAAHCHGLLHQQSLKRVHKRFDLTPPGTGASSQQQQAKDQPTSSPYMYRLYLSKNSVTMALQNCLLKCNSMDAHYSQPTAISPGVLQICVNQILKAVLIMRGVMIDAVIIKAYHEPFTTGGNSSSNNNNNGTFNTLSGGEANSASVGQSRLNQGPTASNNHSSLADGDASHSPFVDDNDDIDLWSESRYTVFRKLTHHANAAVLHFQYPTYPEIAFRSFLSWFNSYSDLFAATCSRCNTRLRRFMPPICRDFSTGFYPYHDNCK